MQEQFVCHSLLISYPSDGNHHILTQQLFSTLCIFFSLFFLKVRLIKYFKKLRKSLIYRANLKISHKKMMSQKRRKKAHARTSERFKKMLMQEELYKAWRRRKWPHSCSYTKKVTLNIKLVPEKNKFWKRAKDH